MFVVLVFYTFGCVQVLLFSSKAMVRPGEVAAMLAITANLGAVFLGGTARAIAALPVLVLGSVAASRAFKLADDLRPDTDEERAASRAAMALVGLAIGEAIIIVVAAFMWTLASTW